jgi:hypothetical protein
MSNFNVSLTHVACLLVDVQEKLFQALPEQVLLLKILSQIVQSCQLLHIPLFLTEQYPKGLGHTIPSLQALLGKSYQPWTKTCFSCLDEPSFKQYISSLSYSQWIVIGIETHICVLQTVKDLLKMGKQVVVLNDATSSRALHNCITALAEMHDAGARISCSETILFELLKDAQNPCFKPISQLIQG